MKKLLILAGIVVALVAGVLVYLHVTKSKDLAPLVAKKLQQLVHDGSNGLYNLQLDSVEIDVLAAGMVVYGARLTPDSGRLQQLAQMQNAPDNLYRLSVKQIRVAGVSPKDFISKKNIALDRVQIQKPIVEIFHQTGNKPTKPGSPDLYTKLSKDLESFTLNDLLIDSVAFTYYNQDKGGRTTQLNNLSCHLVNVQLDSSTRHDTTRFLFAKEATLTLKHYEQLTPNGLHRFTVDSLSLVATAKSLQLFNVSLKPAGKKEDFGSKLKYRQDRYDLQVNRITATAVDWFNLLLNQTIIADEVTIEKGSWEIFSDHRVPASGKPTIGSFPHQKITQLHMPVYIKQVRVNDLDVYYQEFNTQSAQKGSVEFHHASGTVENITNAVDKIKADSVMRVKASAAFMDAGTLHASFVFDLRHAALGNFTVDASMGAMDATRLNKATIPLALFEVKSGRLEQFIFHMQGNNNRAKGYTSIAYRDLKVNVLKKEEDSPGGVKKRGLASFILNTFTLAQSSPHNGRQPIEQHVSYTHLQQQTFWGFVWKTLLECLKPTIKGEK